MRTAQWAALPLLSLLSTCLAEAQSASAQKSKQILPSTFKPPQVFRNADLVRTINLEKGYPRETVNVIVENVDKKPQSEYYLPFDGSTVGRVGSLEAKDKNDASKGAFSTKVVEFDTKSDTEYYLITLPTPLKPSEKITLSITYSILSAPVPLPAEISQGDQQFLQFTFSAYLPSAYTSVKQKTRVKFGSSNVPDFTKLLEKNTEGKEDPSRQGNTITYGPYGEVPAGAYEPVSVRYEFTKPLNHATRLERDIEVSHWGGNLATEERYWLTNRGASLKDHFSRVQWQMTAYANPPTSALKELRYPLTVGTVDAYYTDDIGNVSTSRFRSTPREAMLELKPRYPVFGGWKYSFKVGWNGELNKFLRKLKSGEGYALKVPFLEGPKMSEGVEYERVQLRVILPEGAKNIRFETTVPYVESEVSNHLTFMDTLGRPTLTITSMNLVDDLRDREIVVLYDYPWTAGFRKPLTIFAAFMSMFVTLYVLGSLDYSIGKKKN